ASDCMRRRGLETDVDIYDSSTLDRHDLDVGIGDQRCRDQSPPQVVDLRSFELIARLEPGNDRQVMRAESWTAACVNGSKSRDGPRIHRQSQCREVSSAI